jgi:hypothetical protein
VKKMRKKYEYLVNYTADGGSGICSLLRSSTINDFRQILKIQSEISVKFANKQKVIIDDYKLMRVRRWIDET